MSGMVFTTLMCSYETAWVYGLPRCCSTLKAKDDSKYVQSASGKHLQKRPMLSKTDVSESSLTNEKRIYCPIV